MFTEFGSLCSGVISPTQEITSYEAIWTRCQSVRGVATLFERFNHALPSAIAQEEGISPAELDQVKDKVRSLLPFQKFSALFFNDFEYPQRLRDAKHPVEVLYYRGALDLLSSRSVSVVGARKPSDEGVRRARKIAHLLVKEGFTVMSGLAAGIDTAAHQAAIEAHGRTIAVIGTALHDTYPRANRELQQEIARNHLLISQVPFYQYSLQDYRKNRWFFPERNKTMSALSEATIIVEASETSGTLIQAQAAIEQGRTLFILKSCFEKGLKWPDKFLQKGAIKLEDGSEILDYLGPTS